MSEVERPQKKKFNWWIPAFFIALFAFEVTREVYVLNTIPKIPNVFSQGLEPRFFSGSGYATAYTNGEWSQSSDDSEFDKIFKTFSSIECSKNTGQCTEYSVIVNANDRGYVFLNLDSMDYQIDSFTDNEVVYSDASECYTYKVSINLATKSTTAIKERTPLNTLPQCADTPARRVYTLNYENPKFLPKTIDDTKAFLPIFRIIKVAIDAF